MRGGRPRSIALRRAAVAADRVRSRRDPRSEIIAAWPTPIILDCDPGHDDAIALLLALGSPELELLGVTTTYGNQTLEKTTANALRVLELAGRGDVPVASGASAPLERKLVVAAHVHGESGLDGPTLPPPSLAPVSEDAVEWMAGVVADAAGPVTLVPTGPLTNVARYLDEHGADGLERIVLMGGAIAEGNMTPAAEFNVWADPEAAQAVLDAPLDVTMIGLDVTHKAVTGPDVQRRLRDAGSIGVFVAELVDFFTVYHRETYGWDGAPIHDAVAVAHVLRPGLVQTKLRNVEVERESELCRGRTVVDLLAPHGPPRECPRRRRPRLGGLLRPARRAHRQTGVGSADGGRDGLRRGSLRFAEQVRGRRRDGPYRARPAALHVDELPGRLRLRRGDARRGRRPARRTLPRRASRRSPAAASAPASSASST